jgi:hypothetical protein
MKDSSGFSGIIHSITWRANLAVWFNRALAGCGWGIVATATGIVLFKMLWPPLWLLGLALLAALPLVLGGAWMDCRKRGRFFLPREVVEIIDHRFRDDGVVASAWENPELIPPEALHSEVVRVLGGRLPRLDLLYYAKRTTPALLLLAAALVVPPRHPAVPAQAEAILASITQPLADKLNEGEQILPEDTLQEFQQELEKIQQDEQGISREKWEAVEELDQRIESAVAQSRQEAQAAMTSLESLSNLADASGNIEGKADLNQQQDALLKDLEKSMSSQNSRLPSALRKEIAGKVSQMRQGGMSNEELRKKLSELQSKMGQMSGFNSDGPGQIGQSGDGNGNGNGPDGDGAPGSGGISRGRGDAQLTLGSEKRAEGAQFKQQELAGQFLSPQDMVDMGITPLEPKAEPGKFSPGTLRQFEAQTGSEVSRTRISPSQKNVIEKYFSGQ